MTDFLKDVFDAAQSRIRSPFIGSIVIVFLVINWQPLFYVLFADKPVRARFLYFDANTDPISLCWLPIGLGIAISLTAPWLKYLGAWWASFPMGILRKLEHREKGELEDYTLRLEEKRVAIREHRLEQANLDRRAEEENLQREQAKAEQQKLEIEEKRPPQTPEQIAEELSEMQGLMVTYLGRANGLVKAFEFARDPGVQHQSQQILPSVSEQRLRVEGENLSKELRALGLVSGNQSYELTTLGYQVYDLLLLKRKGA